MKPVRIHRRTLLRGAASTAIGLPWLEAMMGPKAAYAQTTAPLRYLVCFGGYSLGKDVTETETVIPRQAGPLAGQLRRALLPLDSLTSDFSVISGLRIPHTRVDPNTGANADDGGRRNDGDSFHFHVNPLMAGKRQIHDAFNVQVTGESSDQIVARSLNSPTLIPSLNYRVQPAAYGFRGESLERGTLSFADNSGSITPIEPISDPGVAFASLVSNVRPNDPAARAEFDRRAQDRRSVLDLVDRRIGGLAQRLGTSDKQRLERYFTDLRELEMRANVQPIPEQGSCAIPAQGSYGNIATGYSDEEDRGRIFADLMTMAFACDLTRVGTLMYTFWQTNMNFAPTNIEGALEAKLHDITHSHEDPIALDAAIVWHMRQWAYLLNRLKTTEEGSGNLLDNMAILYLKEGGFNPGSSHTTDNMVALVAGRAGGRLRMGQHFQANRAHPAQVIASMMQTMGVANTGFGDISGQFEPIKA
ncbi:MAG: DUF1552 domain-containing protein [Myxococcota bacterium]